MCVNKLNKGINSSFAEENAIFSDKLSAKSKKNKKRKK